MYRLRDCALRMKGKCILTIKELEVEEDSVNWAEITQAEILRKSKKVE